MMLFNAQDNEQNVILCKIKIDFYTGGLNLPSEFDQINPRTRRGKNITKL